MLEIGEMAEGWAEERGRAEGRKGERAERQNGGMAERRNGKYAERQNGGTAEWRVHWTDTKLSVNLE